MNKLITTVLILTALFTALFTAFPVSTAAAPSIVTTQLNASYNADKRVQALQNVFEKYNSPLVPFAADYVEIADRYEMDWRLLPAIAGLESSFGKRQLSGSHNSYGWGGGRIYFESVEDGIDTINKALKEKYAARGATTVETIGPIYAESPTWAPRVRSFMNKFDTELARISLHNLELTI